MTVRERLRELVEQMDDPAAAEALDDVQWLLSPEDDELTGEELRQAEAGAAELARGESVTLTDLRRSLGR